MISTWEDHLWISPSCESLFLRWPWPLSFLPQVASKDPAFHLVAVCHRNIVYIHPSSYPYCTRLCLQWVLMHVFGLWEKSTWRKPTQAWGETQKGPRSKKDSNMGLYCCESLCFPRNVVFFLPFNSIETDILFLVWFTVTLSLPMIMFVEELVLWHFVKWLSYHGPLLQLLYNWIIGPC